MNGLRLGRQAGIHVSVSDYDIKNHPHLAKGSRRGKNIHIKFEEKEYTCNGYSELG